MHVCDKIQNMVLQNILLYIGIISTVFLAFFGVGYSLLGYNTNFQNWLIESVSAKAQTANMKDESELLGKRVYVKRKARDIRVNVYRPDTDEILPAVFFAHSSSFVDSDADESDGFCDWFSKEFHCAVFSVNYTKIDVHVATYPQDEIADAVRYFRSEAEAYGIDRNRFVMMGISAGAYLSLIASLHLIQKGIIPHGYIMVNPFIDYTAVSFALAGIHPEPLALITTGKETRPGRWEEYHDALRRSDVLMRRWQKDDAPSDLLEREESRLSAEDRESRMMLVNWLHDRLDIFFS